MDWPWRSFRWTWFNGKQRSLIILSSFFALCVVECCVYCRWKTWALWVAGWTRNWIGIWTWIRAMARIVQVCGQFQSEGAIFNPNIRCHRILVLRFAPTKFPLRPIRPNGWNFQTAILRDQDPEDLGTAWQPPLWFDQVWEPKQLSISQLTLFLSLSRLQANISWLWTHAQTQMSPKGTHKLLILLWRVRGGMFYLLPLRAQCLLGGAWCRGKFPTP